MKKIAPLIILVFVIQILTYSQSCFPEGITFSNQAEIYFFQTNYPNCTEIEGDVWIEGWDIRNLDGLNCITAIGGDLKIYFNYDLTNIMGLQNITAIGGNLSIEENDNLINLSGLDSLTTIGNNLSIGYNGSLTSIASLQKMVSVGGGVSIGSNWSLTSLSGLENINYIPEYLTIYNCHNLTSLVSLSGITSIGGGLTIGQNNVFTSLAGLDNVVSIGGHVEISQTDALESLSGLDNVTSIGGELILNYNDALKNLTGLEKLRSIGGSLTIFDNDSLSSLIGIDSLMASSIMNLVISENYSLNTCEVQSVCDYLANPNGDIIINNNSKGCNNKSDVEEACINWIPNINSESVFTIYPNPAKSVLNIDFLNDYNIQNTTIKIIDINGKTMLKLEPVSTSTQIDIKRIKTGLYLVKVQNHKTFNSKRLIIQ